MFEGLIEFIEESVFSLVNKITGEEQNGANSCTRSSRCCSASPRRTPA